MPPKQVPIKIIANKYMIYLEPLLGKGACGAVYKGCLKDNRNEKFAIKIISYNSLKISQQLMTTLQRELQIQKDIDSQFVVKMIDDQKVDNESYIILEYCDQGNLAQMLKKQINNRFPQDQAFKYFFHIVQGYKDLYRKNIVHRDLKPENILFKEDIAKISDFGFSRILDDMDKEQRLTLLGTPWYVAPEILKCQNYSSNGNIWSLGCVFFEMLYGFSPYRDCNSIGALIQKQQNKIQFPQEPAIDNKYIKLIEQMLKINPSERLKWDALFEDPLIKYNLNQIKQKETILDKSNNSFIDQMRQQNDIYQTSIQIDQLIKLEFQKRDFTLQTIRQVFNVNKLLKQPIEILVIFYVAVIKQLQLTSENLSNLVQCKNIENFNVQQFEFYKKSDQYIENINKFKSHQTTVEEYRKQYFPNIQKACSRIQDQDLIQKINKYKDYSENDNPQVGNNIYLQLIKYYLKDLIKFYKINDQAQQNLQVIESILNIYQLIDMSTFKTDSRVNFIKVKLQKTPIAELINQIESIYLSL